MGVQLHQKVSKRQASRIKPGVSSKKCEYQSRWVVKFEIMFLMFREKHVFLPLMQRRNHNLLFLKPLCGDFAPPKMVVSLQRGYRNRFCASHAPYEALFFVLLMQRENHVFEIDLTPSVFQ